MIPPEQKQNADLIELAKKMKERDKYPTPEEFTLLVWSNYKTGETINDHDFTISTNYSKIYEDLKKTKTVVRVLMEALSKYGSHHQACSRLRSIALMEGKLSLPCECGFNDAFIHANEMLVDANVEGVKHEKNDSM